MSGAGVVCAKAGGMVVRCAGGGGRVCVKSGGGEMGSEAMVRFFVRSVGYCAYFSWIPKMSSLERCLLI